MRTATGGPGGSSAFAVETPRFSVWTSESSKDRQRRGAEGSHSRTSAGPPLPTVTRNQPTLVEDEDADSGSIASAEESPSDVDSWEDLLQDTGSVRAPRTAIPSSVNGTRHARAFTALPFWRPDRTSRASPADYVDFREEKHRVDMQHSSVAIPGKHATRYYGPPKVLYMSFNQNQSCLAVGTTSGFTVYNTDPFIPCYREGIY